MKVVQILPELVSGGVERGTLEISRALIAAGHDSLVISAGGPMVEQLEQEGGQHLTLPVHKKNLQSLCQIRALRRALIEHNVDIIHARSRVPAWIAYLAWKGMPKDTRPRFMTTFHGFHSVSAYSAIMTKGERVITVSESVKSHILENYPKTAPDKLTVIHRGVSDKDYPHGYQPSADSDATRLRASIQDKYLLTLPGRITGWKGGELFLQVLAELKKQGIPVHGWFAGGTHAKRTKFLEELQQQASDLGLTEDISFLGQRSDLKDIMAVSDVVLSLSTKEEAFGRVSLEALRLGKPVLGFDHGGVAEQLSTLFPEGAVPPEDLNATVSKLNSWYHQRPTVVTKESPFTLEHMQQAVIAIYRELIR